MIKIRHLNKRIEKYKANLAMKTQPKLLRLGNHDFRYFLCQLDRPQINVAFYNAYLFSIPTIPTAPGPP